MPLTLPPPPLSRDDTVSRRLDEVAARLRRTVILRAGAQLLLLVVLFVATLGYLDHRYHLPGLVRALGLVSILVGVPLFVRRWIVQPLRGSGDPVQIALRVERAYPEFNDSLVSAVQFLRQRPGDRSTSPGLRKAAIRRAAAKADRYEFDRAVESRFTRRSVLGAVLAMTGAGFLIYAAPDASRIALIRLAVPFGGAVTPTKTTIEILSPSPLPHRMARGEPLDVHVVLRGHVPDRVSVSIKLEGATSIDQSYAVTADETNPALADLIVRLEPTRIPRDFQFKIKANDADTGWQSVSVLPPPILIPLDGRPSPQIRLDFPKYTDLASQELPDGSGVIDCIAGTRVTLRAATDRPVARAYIAFRPEQPRFLVVPMLAAIGPISPLAIPGFDLLGREVWAEVPVAIGRNGTLLEVAFTPRLTGPYAFRFEDETGLGSTRMFDVRVQPDPAPLVLLERPAGGRDSLLVLPDAEITVQAKVLDKLFAVRTVRLEYRTGADQPNRAFPWFDADLAGRMLPAGAALMRGPLPIPTQEPLRLRPQQLAFETRLSLTRIRHPDGSPLKEGDVVTLQVAAEDFDDVNDIKASGRSHEVELLVVSKTHLEDVENETQADIRNELLRLHGQQKDARAKVQEALGQLRTNGKMRPEDAEKLAQAEQTQQQIRSRLSNTEDGPRAAIEKLKQSAKDNRLPRSATTDRLDAAGAELKRLADEELEPLEADLAGARKVDPKQSPAAPLSRAEKRQKGVENTLQSLIEQLEPWSGAGQIRGEARGLLGEIKRQIEKAERTAEKTPEGSPEQLTPEQKGELEKNGLTDDRIAERGRQLVEKMNRLAVEKDAAVANKLDLAAKKGAEAEAKRNEAKGQPAGSAESKRLNREATELDADAKQARDAAEDIKREADALRNAATAGNAEQLKEQLRQAGGLTRQNQPGRAANEQKAAAANLEKLLNSLDEQKAQDADRMSKKLKDANADLNKLLDEQERLQKKVEAAEQLKDPMQRQAELEKLAREQEKIEAEAKDLTQRLTRNQSEPAAQELRRATREMEQARERLENGEAASEKMDDALDRLDDAQRELDQANRKNEEELAREQMAKFADDIKALRDREQRLLDESARIHALVKKDKKWERPVRTSLNDLRRQQETLAGEVRALLEKKFQSAAVFGRMLRQSADAMDLAGKRIDSRLDAAETGPFDLELEDIADAGIQSQQKLSLKRLDQLIESLKPDKNPAGGAAPPMGGGGMPPDMVPGAGKPGEQLPPLAQLKALRSLQADIAERTSAFDKAHPDRTKLNDDETAELESLEKMQLDVAELIKEVGEG